MLSRCKAVAVWGVGSDGGSDYTCVSQHVAVPGRPRIVRSSVELVEVHMSQNYCEGRLSKVSVAQRQKKDLQASEHHRRHGERSQAATGRVQSQISSCETPKKVA